MSLHPMESLRRDECDGYAQHDWAVVVGACHSRSNGHLRNEYCYRCHTSKNTVTRVLTCPACRALPPTTSVTLSIPIDLVDDHAWSEGVLAWHTPGEGHATRSTCGRCDAQRTGGPVRGTAGCPACHLAAPVIEAPAAGAVVRPAPLEIRWQPVPSARSYRLTLIDLVANTKLYSSEIVAGTSFQVPAEMLAPAREYQVAVRAVSDMPYDDAPVAERRFHVRGFVWDAAVTDVTRTGARVAWTNAQPCRVEVLVFGDDVSTTTQELDVGAGPHQLEIHGLRPDTIYRAWIVCRQAGIIVGRHELAFHTKA